MVYVSDYVNDCRLDAARLIRYLTPKKARYGRYKHAQAKLRATLSEPPTSGDNRCMEWLETVLETMEDQQEQDEESRWDFSSVKTHEEHEKHTNSVFTVIRKMLTNDSDAGINLKRELIKAFAADDHINKKEMHALVNFLLLYESKDIRDKVQKLNSVVNGERRRASQMDLASSRVCVDYDVLDMFFADCVREPVVQLLVDVMPDLAALGNDVTEMFVAFLLLAFSQAVGNPPPIQRGTLVLISL